MSQFIHRTGINTRLTRSYDGHRLVVSCSGRGTLRKTDLQGAFNEFGHILQIEMPRAGFGLITFGEYEDAREAMECMNGKTVNGMQITVGWASMQAAKSSRDAPDEVPASERPGGSRSTVTLLKSGMDRDMAQRLAKRQAQLRHGDKGDESPQRQREASSQSGSRSRGRSQRRKRQSKSRSPRRSKKSRSRRRR
eukprot:TRINITY_DN76978_c0_g1_i1.p1 TRINITY_DN76978_c0_g1~~TRINITY_DN76978_c0_g1_i1.p1  ORF type:complete len:194 (+),score=19.38 TRINITY_DN76978_c0_g1_i1:1-582(+)